MDSVEDDFSGLIRMYDAVLRQTHTSNVHRGELHAQFVTEVNAIIQQYRDAYSRLHLTLLLTESTLRVVREDLEHEREIVIMLRRDLRRADRRLREVLGGRRN